MAWYVLDSYGITLHRSPRLRDALVWTVPDSHHGMSRPCTICTRVDLGGGTYEVRTCEGLYTVTRHAPEPASPSTPPPCTGSLWCPAEVHIHGCYADHGACDSPDEHERQVSDSGSTGRPS